MILAAHIFCCLFMTGVIWFVQVVHYPLFSIVSEDRLPQYMQKHQQWTSLVVTPIMLVELITGFALLIHSQTFDWVIQMIALGVIWASTLFLQIPCHQKLLQKFDQKVHQRLIWTNWIRTLLWTARSISFMMLF